jgi:hypothetical protein
VSEAGTDSSSPDRNVVERQLGRTPRGDWRVECRCTLGYPSVIATAPTLPDGTPFPTLFWLTCPWLCSEASRLESNGAVAAWSARSAGEPVLAQVLRDADTAYRAARAAEAGICSATGIAGQRDPLEVKCLHSRVAAALAGIRDPVGLAVLAEIPGTCPDERCSTSSAAEEGHAPDARRW